LLEKYSVIRVTRWLPTLRQAGFGEGALEKYPPGQLAGGLLYLMGAFGGGWLEKLSQLGGRSLATYPTVRAVLRGGGDSDVISLPDQIERLLFAKLATT
jgi:hypothetical protein